MKNIEQMRKENIKKDFIVENLMKSNGLYCLVARPKVGKSLLALQLAYSIATGTNFLGFRTNPSPVLYISTEMDSTQLISRIDKMNLQFSNENFLFKEQNPTERKLNLMDLQIEFSDFTDKNKCKFVIIDMMCGVDLNNSYDLNNYQDIGQYVIPQYRELCKKYNLTILLIHHLNKNNTSLGSTAIDGSVDGKITLKQDNNIKNKIIFSYESRDFEGQELVLKRNENLIFEISKAENDDLNPNIILFLNYAIRHKEITFKISDITSNLNLQITPSSFGKLLKNNLEYLKNEGLNIEFKRNSKERIYYDKYEEPNFEE